MKFSNKILFFLLFTVFSFKFVAQEKKAIDATKIAGDYYNSIVKILLTDSVAEKKTKSSGYLGRGSGFIVTEDGYVFTNRHVIDYCLDFMRYTYYDPADKKIHESADTYDPKALTDPSFLSVNYVSKASPVVQVYTDKFGNYKLYDAKVVAIDTANFDGAILKIIFTSKILNDNPQTNMFHPVPLGNSDSTNQGEDLCVYGFPAQYDAGLDIMLRDQSTLTFGKHSGFDYVFNSIYGVIKTDASINSGNSGGPVFNQSNKVIGIATSASEKTNTGLIGGINAMYNLASLNPELLKRLTEKGLVAPGKKIEAQTAVLPTPHIIPSQKELKKINIFKKNERKFKGGNWYFKGFTPISQGYKYTINASTNKGFITNSVAPLNVKIKSGFGGEVGHLFPLWRISPKQKLSLDWTLLNIYIGKEDWSNSNYYRDTLNTPIAYRVSTEQIRFSTGLGLTYSQIIARQFILDFFYKASLFATNSTNSIGEFDNNIYADLNYETEPGILNTLGMNFRYKLYMIGLEYSFGSAKIRYDIRYKYNTGSSPQTTADGNASVFGYQKIKTLNLTAGIVLGGKKKWKKLLRREYKKSQ